MIANQWNASMTLGQARKLLDGPGWACACVGPPIPSPPGTPCCCRLAFAQAEALVRAAHIVARLIQDAAQKMSRADGCPFHDLPPEETVVLKVDGMAFPYSAERACVSYHTALFIERAMEDSRRAIGEWLDGLEGRTSPPDPVV